MPSLRALLVVAALTAVGASAPGPTTARAADVRPAGPVQLVGNGYGHGHGLSQWGAQRQAEAGRGYRQILRFYYPGLKDGTASGRVAVLISADTTTDVTVVDRDGLQVKSLATGKTLGLAKPAKARLWRITPAAGGSRSTVAWKNTGSWTTFRTVPGEAQFVAGDAPITLVLPGERRAYRGALRSAAPSASSGKRDTVNVLPIDSYLKGVVPREVYTSWKPAALQAQAVAARTYAAHDISDGVQHHWDICDTTACQVYGGYDDEVASTNAAIDATRGEILTADGAPAFTQFSASNGGWMSAGSQPYLVAKQDPYDDTYRGWTDSIAPRELERALPAIGTFRRVTVLKRDGNGTWDGRVLSIKVVGSRGSATLTGEEFRSSFGLNSTWFTVR